MATIHKCVELPNDLASNLSVSLFVTAASRGRGGGLAIIEKQHCHLKVLYYS